MTKSVIRIPVPAIDTSHSAIRIPVPVVDTCPFRYQNNLQQVYLHTCKPDTGYKSRYNTGYRRVKEGRRGYRRVGEGTRKYGRVQQCTRAHGRAREGKRG